MKFKNVKIEIYIPEKYIKPLIKYLNDLGACRVGNYDSVVSYGKVFGYWRPLENSNPVNGQKHALNFGEECKLEIICPSKLIDQAIKIIKTNHPYEEPVINILPLLDY